MEKNRIIQLLKIEHECMLRKSSGLCDSSCAVCELVQDDMELDEMYKEAIKIIQGE